MVEQKVGYLSKYSFIAIICVVEFINTAIAEKMPPVFNHFWYITAKDNGYKKDLCNKVTDYVYSEKFTDIEQSSSDFYEKLPQLPDCKWTKPTLTPVIDSVPMDFPGTKDDYKKINNQKTVKWESFCVKDPQGFSDIVEKKYFYPSYVCPEKTMLVEENKFKGCYPIKDYSCAGDVIARNLDTRWPLLERFGHVGLSLKNNTLDEKEEKITSTVVEVLDDDPVLQINSLSDFKKRDPNYWGAKFKLANQDDLTVEDLESIGETLKPQLMFQPEYTRSWKWWPAKIKSYYIYDSETKAWIKVFAFIQGRFRCDSFVYYLYAEGAHKKIPYGLIMTPKQLFDTFLKYRSNDGLDAKNSQLLQTPSRLELDIYSVFADKYFDLYKADNAVKSFVEDQTISRVYKVNYLWSLINLYQADKDKAAYILDSMSSLKPLELTSDLFNLYNKTNNLLLKKKIITLLAGSTRYDNLEQINSIAKNNLKNIERIQQFLKAKITDTSLPDIQDTVLIQSASSLPSEMSYKNLILLNSIQKEENNEAFITALLNSIFLEKNLQDKYLEQALHSNQNSHEFKQKICAFIGWLGSDNITPATKEILSGYFEVNKLKMLTSENTLKTCNWLLAYATVKSYSSQQINDVMRDYLLALTDPIEMANLINAMTQTNLNDLGERARLKLEHLLNKSDTFIKNAVNSTILSNQKRAINRLKPYRH